MTGEGILVTGANGQLGRALRRLLPDAQFVGHEELDITNPTSVRDFPWGGVRVLINAAAHTDVDGAETPEGGTAARRVNSFGVANLVRAAKIHGFALVHISSEYVFNGEQLGPASEELEHWPLSAYGKSKSEGDKIVQTLEKYLLIRTSWVVGDGKNIIRTMERLAKEGRNSEFVSDQIGRLTFADDLARGIIFLLEHEAPYGTYNLTNEGEPASWAEVARTVYGLCGRRPGDVTMTTTAKYFADKPEAATRPLNSVLDLSKIEAAGFTPRDWRVALTNYLAA
jgi:dTDP-4-dehydrorhamnose 3,5-epimerase